MDAKAYRQKMKNLRNRAKDNIKNKGRKAFRGKRALDLRGNGFSDVPFFTPENGENTIDIIPFEVSTDRFPDLKRGDLVYILDFWIHRGVGPLNSVYVCPKSTFGKPCPICEERQALLDAGHDKDDKECKDLAPSHRALYNIINVNEKEKEIQLFTTSYAYFEIEMLEKAETEGKKRGLEEGLDTFIYIDKGESIKFRAVPKKFGKANYFKFKDFEFVEREEQYSPDIISKTYPLDKLVVESPYEEINNAFHGLVDEDDDDDGNGDDDGRDSQDGGKPFEREANETVEQETSGPGKCPHGLKWGEGCDSDPAKCDDCQLWEQCYDDQVKMKRAARSDK